MRRTLAEFRQEQQGSSPAARMAARDEWLREAGQAGLDEPNGRGRIEWQRPLAGQPGGMVETVESGSLTRRPLRVIDRQALQAAPAARLAARAGLAAARQREAARRAGVAGSLAGLERLLRACETSRQSTARLLLDRRAARFLMALPPNGRTLDPGYEQGTAVNGSEMTAARRWQGTPAGQRFRIGTARRVWSERPDGRRVSRLDGGQPLDSGCRSSLDGGRTWQPFEPPKPQRARGTGKRSSAAAAARQRRLLLAGTIRLAEQD